MAQIIDGKLVSNLLRQEVASSCVRLKERGVVPGLTVVIVGDDPASKIYVTNKGKACRAVGIDSREYALPAQTTQGELLKLIAELSEDDTVDGILVQLPLPGHIDEQAVIDAIPVHKDVDAFHPVNVGKIMIGKSDFLPCTPAGVMELLKYYQIDPCGKECVVLGRSNIVGKPMAMLLLHANGTVTVCHSRTRDIIEAAKRADILVAAVGIPRFVTAEMVKDGAVVIDVGMNRQDNGKLCGDVDFDAIAQKASFITPVPGGVGPMTITMLLKNTLKAACLHHGLDTENI